MTYEVGSNLKMYNILSFIDPIPIFVFIIMAFPQCYHYIFLFYKIYYIIILHLSNHSHIIVNNIISYTIVYL